jgi:ribosomal protein S7
MKKFYIFKKDENSSLDFFLSKIKVKLIKFNKNYNYINNNLFINHNFYLLSKNFNYKLKKKINSLYSTFSLFFDKYKKKIFFDLYLKFFSFIFKVGKKFFWENAFSLIFSNLTLNLGYSKITLLSKIFIRLFTYVELKRVKSRKRISFIPFFIKIKRSLFLALKWIFLSSIQNKSKISFQNKLYIELMQILTLKSCSSLNKLEENNINSFKNRANIHFRWDRSQV